MNSGRILTGQVSRNAIGLSGRTAEWKRVQVVLEDIKFVANDLRDLYRKQRDSIVEPTPATHVALANWCIAYRLYDEVSRGTN